jgi:AraC-like DNA-binding protein
LQPAETIDAFCAAPSGRYWLGSSYLVWCHGASLRGSVFWGTPTAADLSAATHLFAEIDAAGADHDVVTDCRRLARVDWGAYETLMPFVQGKVGHYRAHRRRHAVVCPAALAVAAPVAGFLPLAGAEHAWTLHADSASAFAALGRIDALAIDAEVQRIVAAVIDAPPILHALRAWLATASGRPTLPRAARALALSARSLQRALGRAATSFRAETASMRVEAARRLLADTDLKLEAIARRVGFASQASFTSMFARITGQAPGAYRARATTGQRSAMTRYRCRRTPN